MAVDEHQGWTREDLGVVIRDGIDFLVTRWRLVSGPGPDGRNLVFDVKCPRISPKIDPTLRELFDMTFEYGIIAGNRQATIEHIRTLKERLGA